MARSHTTALISILGVAVLGSTVALTTKAAKTDYTFYDPIVDVHTMLERLYVEESESADLQRGAIEGMIEQLNDPYTTFVPARLEDDFNKSIKGEYVGIGAEVIKRNGWLTIVSPMDGSPAWRAGVMADDRVVSIEGEKTDALEMNECIERLMGEPGTDVTIRVDREGEELEITITRDHIKVQAVKGYMRDDGGEGAWRSLIDEENGIAYVRLTQFTPGCADELRSMIEQAQDRAGGELGGLILDLRDNPGGLLDEAVAIADLFLDSGVIVSTKGRAYEGSTERASSGSPFADVPMVTLINSGSASASEVLSGALGEHERSVVLGTRSFGKGSVQSVRPLRSGAGVLKITEQYYALPSGRVLHRRDDSSTWGVDPSEGYYLPVSDDELRAMLIARRDQEVIHKTEPIDLSDTAGVLARLEDPQLSAAHAVMAHRVASGEFAPVGLETPAGDAIAYDELGALRRSEERLLRQLTRIDERISAIEQQVVRDEDPIDLWDDDADISGGVMLIRDKDGNVVAELDITGRDVERWLYDADVKKRESAQGSGSSED